MLFKNLITHKADDFFAFAYGRATGGDTRSDAFCVTECGNLYRGQLLAACGTRGYLYAGFGTSGFFGDDFIACTVLDRSNRLGCRNKSADRAFFDTQAFGRASGFGFNNPIAKGMCNNCDALGIAVLTNGAGIRFDTRFGTSGLFGDFACILVTKCGNGLIDKQFFTNSTFLYS